MRHSYSQRGWKSWGLASTGLALAVFAGCARTTQEDVADARQAVQEERNELGEVRTEAREAVNEEMRDVQQARREANKPILDEHADVAEARREGNEAIRAEQKDVQQAERNARETEMKFEAEKARDAYVADAQAKLDQAAKRIEQHRENGKALEGAAKDANDAKVEKLSALHDRAEEAVGDLKSTEVLEWTQSRDNVDRALNDLAREMEQAS